MPAEWSRVAAVHTDVINPNSGDPLANRNYRQVKRQKEEARKTRQMQKQQRRADRASTAGVTPAVEPAPQERESVDQAPLPESQDSHSR